jgi:hypothetical protein
MKWQRSLSTMVFLVCFSGCLWPFHSARPVTLTNIPAAILVEVLRPDRLDKEGKLVFIPFSAGLNAEAGPQLDHLALMMVKGASEAFQKNASPIQMIDEGDPNAADMVLEGHIEEFHTRGGWTAIGIGRKTGALVIKGEVRDRRTNEIVVLITGRREFRKVKEAETVAYNVGHEIAEQLVQPESRP